jgi:hypothetical protein
MQQLWRACLAAAQAAKTVYFAIALWQTSLTASVESQHSVRCRQQQWCQNYFCLVMHLHSIATASGSSIDVLPQRLLEVLVRLAAGVDD